MPYIVTTKRPEDGEFLNPVNGQSQPYGPTESLSRRAVATLEEARAVVKTTCGTDLMAPLEASLLPGSGGAVTLPDGTVIEVEPILWESLAAMRYAPVAAAARGGNRELAQDMLDHFNAREQAAC
jgi:hypothetical protein